LGRKQDPLPSKYEALNSNLSTTKKKKKQNHDNTLPVSMFYYFIAILPILLLLSSHGVRNVQVLKGFWTERLSFLLAMCTTTNG
jgi:hypothetical protein